MNFKSFRESFSKTNSNIYIIECKDQYIKKLVQGFLTKYFNSNYEVLGFSLAEKSFSEIIDHFRNPTLFGEKYLIFVSDCNGCEKEIINLLLKKKEYKNKIFFFFNKLKNNKLLDVSKKNSCFFSINPPQKMELINIVKKFFLKNKIKTESNVEEFIVDSTSNDLEALYSELRKIVDFHNKEEILKINQVKKIIFSTKEESIFNFIDNFLNKNMKKTIENYNNLLQLKTDVEFILNMLINNITNIILIKSLNEEKNYKYNEIQKILNINPYALKKQYSKAKELNFNFLLTLLENLINLQYKIRKAGKDKEVIFRDFLLNYLF